MDDLVAALLASWASWDGEDPWPGDAVLDAWR